MLLLGSFYFAIFQSLYLLGCIYVSTYGHFFKFSSDFHISALHGADISQLSLKFLNSFNLQLANHVCPFLKAKSNVFKDDALKHCQ